MGNHTVSTYETLAPEYYDSVLHPTCANFRQASYSLLKGWLQLLLDQDGTVCEVGAGKSIMAELLTLDSHILDKLFLVDSSPSMLAYSNYASTYGAKLILCDVEALPIPSGSISVVVSSLGDPYNTLWFWKETSRILKPAGLVLFTAPSYEWAVAYRGGSVENFAYAEFELANGRKVRVPSMIYPVNEQIRLIESSGFRVEEITHIPLSALNPDKLSRKLSVLKEPKSSVVSGYLASKSCCIRP